MVVTGPTVSYFDHLDKNKDGAISQEEFREMFMQPASFYSLRGPHAPSRVSGVASPMMAECGARRGCSPPARGRPAEAPVPLREGAPTLHLPGRELGRAPLSRPEVVPDSSRPPALKWMYDGIPASPYTGSGYSCGPQLRPGTASKGQSELTANELFTQINQNQDGVVARSEFKITTDGGVVDVGRMSHQHVQTRESKLSPGISSGQETLELPSRTEFLMNKRSEVFPPSRGHSWSPVHMANDLANEVEERTRLLSAAAQSIIECLGKTATPLAAPPDSVSQSAAYSGKSTEKPTDWQRALPSPCRPHQSEQSEGLDPFDLFDRNKDAVISRQELMEGLSSPEISRREVSPERAWSEEMLRRDFRAFAEGAFGSVTHAFDALAAQASRQRPRGTAAATRGGALDLEDFGVGCKLLRYTRPIDDVFSALDVDADGLMTVSDLLDAIYFPNV